MFLMFGTELKKDTKKTIEFFCKTLLFKIMAYAEIPTKQSYWAGFMRRQLEYKWQQSVVILNGCHLSLWTAEAVELLDGIGAGWLNSKWLMKIRWLFCRLEWVVRDFIIIFVHVFKASDGIRYLEWCGGALARSIWINWRRLIWIESFLRRIKK